MNYPYRWSVIIMTAFVLFGCEESEGELSTSASLSFAVPNAGSIMKAADQHVTLDTVKILLKTIQFHNEVEDDSLDFKTEPQILNLDLSGGVNTLATAEIPMGNYHKVSFRIHKPEDDEDPGDSDFFESSSGNDRYSVVVKGHVGETPFTFRSRKTSKQRVDLDPALVIEEEGSEVNVTLTVDVSSWFVDEDGNHLDPLDEGDENEIDNAIRRSFRGFRDDDRSGS